MISRVALFCLFVVFQAVPVIANSVHHEISVPPELLFERSCKKVFASANAQETTDWQGGCECFLPRRQGRGARCCCVGNAVQQIGDEIVPKSGGHSISTIFLFNASVPHLDANSLSKMPNLEELFIDSCLQLSSVDSAAFNGLKMLRKIRISNCPNLVEWNGTMLRENPRIQSLIVQNNGLHALPQMEMVPTANILPMERIDFTGNCLTQIGPAAMRNVAAESVIFNNNKNCLRSVGGNAFPDCRFVSLQFAGNPRLASIHSDAFAGLRHIEHLDLSGTAISHLPHAGLRPLKRLTLRDAPQLKQLPPVLAFPNLVRAEFTYPYHCCFFKYFARDFLARKRTTDDGELEQNYREIKRRMCEGDGAIDVASSLDEDGGEDAAVSYSNATNNDLKDRRRRHIFVQDGGDTLFKDLAEWYRKVEPFKVKPNGPTQNGNTFFANQLAPFSDAELGKGFRLARKCDRSAIDRFYVNISCTPQPDALNPCEDIISYMPLRLVIWPMWLGSIFGNLAVWAVIGAAWQKKMRLHYVFMLNLSFADFLTGVYLAILAFTDWRTANEYYNYAVEWQTGSGCAVAGFLSVFASELSIFSMLMIALEIFYNSRFAFYGRRLNTHWACAALAFGYAYSLAMATLPLLGVSSFQHSSICLPLHIQSSADKIYILLGLSLSGLAFGAMVFLYCLLNCTLRRSKACSTTRAEEDRQILRRTLVLIGTDMLCWVPTLFFGMTAALGWPLITLSSAKWCLVLFYPINSCANPLLYVFLTRTWRDAKRKAGPLIRRSLAATNARGTLSWHKFERFYSNGPKSPLGGGQQQFVAERLLRKKQAEKEEDSEEQRAQTIHCCERGERKKLLGEIFTGEAKHWKGKERRRASDGSIDKNSKKLLASIKDIPAQNVVPTAPSSTDCQSTAAPRRKSLIPRPKISAPPQMSDISESSSASLGSSSHHVIARERKHSEKREKPKEEKKCDGRIVVEPVGKHGNNVMKRESNASNADRDSGRGDSLRSWAKSARPSVITLCWDTTGSRSPPLMAKCADENSQNEIKDIEN